MLSKAFQVKFAKTATLMLPVASVHRARTTAVRFRLLVPVHSPASRSSFRMYASRSAVRRSFRHPRGFFV